MRFLLVRLSLTLLVVGLWGCGRSETSQSHSWKSSQLVADGAAYPLTGTDGQGNVLAVWLQPSGLYASRFTTGAGWLLAQKISDPPINGWQNLHLAVGKSGHAVLCWFHQDPGNSHVQALRYAPDSGWASPENLGDIGLPTDVAIADNGNAFIAADYNVNGLHTPRLARYRQDAEWFTDQIPGFIAVSRFRDLRLAVNGSGDGFVLWTAEDSGSEKVYVSRCSNNLTGEPEVVASLYGPAISANVAVDANGNAMALWGAFDSSQSYHTYACHYAVSSGWGSSVQIDRSGFDCIDQTLAVDSSGNFYAAWGQRSDSFLTTIYLSKYLHGQGWLQPQQAGTGGTGRYPSVGADASGDVFVAWQQYDPQSSFPGDARIYANRYSPGSGWGTQQQLKTTLGGADPPQLTVDLAGRATVIWSQTTGSEAGSLLYGVFFSRFE